MKLSLTSVLLNNKSIDMDVKTDYITLKEKQNMLIIISANVKFVKNFVGTTDYTLAMILSRYSKIGKNIGDIDDSANIGGGYLLSNLTQL